MNYISCIQSCSEIPTITIWSCQNDKLLIKKGREIFHWIDPSKWRLLQKFNAMNELLCVSLFFFKSSYFYTVRPIFGVYCIKFNNIGLQWLNHAPIRQESLQCWIDSQPDTLNDIIKCSLILAKSRYRCILTTHHAIKCNMCYVRGKGGIQKKLKRLS